MRYPPLRYYLERVLRDMWGGISHWAAKTVTQSDFLQPNWLMFLAERIPFEILLLEARISVRIPELSGLMAGDSAICGRLAALILRLRPAGLRFEEFRSPVKRGGLGLRFSNRSGLRPAAI